MRTADAGKKIGGEIGRAGLGVADRGALLMNEGWTEMHEQRRLELAGMSHAARSRAAERGDFVARELEIGEAGDPRAAVEAVAELGGENVDDAGIAAVAVDDEKPPEAVSDYACRNVLDYRHHRLGPEGYGAGEAHVVRREAVPGRWQDRARHRCLAGRRFGDGGGEHGVGAERHVGAVLLDRADRKHKDGALAVEGGDLGRAQLLPQHTPAPISDAERPAGSVSAPFRRERLSGRQGTALR